MRPNCFCAAYRFPHRPGGGQCEAGVTRVKDRDWWLTGHYRVMASSLCADCRLPATTKHMDLGYGTTEFWGHVSTHHDWQEVTTCCEARLIDNQPA